ncbi:recombination protein NinB [Bradyrhizobium sp. Ai1a-2]|uniref:recombination protein NinB n=1 Tax=Bradyrhizobium sp. Ai1a-2 TaxID=196490 RepID=UPI0004052F57|nr:recombination protein NinB [Bradyrhizobium sp. Ai1a-2]
MSRAAFTIMSSIDRQKAVELIARAPLGAFFDLRESTRSREQNNLMWQRLTELSQQLEWGGFRLEPDDWKDVMTAGLRRARVVPNIDGDGFVQIGLHTSKLTTPEMTALLDLMSAFGANHNVTFRDEQESSEDSPSTAATNDEPQTTALADAAGNSGDASAGATNSDFPPSLLSDDWRYVYLQCLSGVRDKAESLHTRHAQAMQMIGGEPTAREKAWMRLAWRLVKRRNEGELEVGEFDQGLRDLLNGPLPPEPRPD